MKTLIFVVIALGLYHIGLGVMLIPQLRKWSENIGKNQLLPDDPVEKKYILQDIDRVGSLNKPGTLSRIREAFRWRKTLLALLSLDHRFHRTAC